MYTPLKCSLQTHTTPRQCSEYCDDVDIMHMCTVFVFSMYMHMQERRKALKLGGQRDPTM